MIKIGIIKEGKNPPDRRVAFTPDQCKYILENFKGVEIVVQSSPVRVITDEEYKRAGISVMDDLSDCDILFGIKEVPEQELIQNKTYFFFSHTIKKQPKNSNLLKSILQKNITLVDYECITDVEHNRVIGFGHYAGIVGAYNGILGYGKKYNLFNLKRARDCKDKKELWEELKKINLPNIKIIVTGNGRVANGAIELLGALNLRRITPHEFVHYMFREPTYTQLHSNDYYESSQNDPWSKKLFYSHPEKFNSVFTKYAGVCDLLIHCSFWNPNAPKMLSAEQMRSPAFRISVIADVSCDINGPLPSTFRSSTIQQPFYGYNPVTEKEGDPFTQETITVMAVDNLPCELPLDSSESFGKELIEKVLPSLLVKDENKLIEHGTIAKAGKLMPNFEYLKEYAS